MENFTLNKLQLGKNDGKKEARLEEFENLFYDFNDIYYKAISPFNFLVLGRKGTGKTLLAELIKKRADGTDNWICKIDNYKRFNIEELKKLKSNTGMSADEYVPIWEWIILIELGKLLILNASDKTSGYYYELKEFFERNSFDLQLNSFKTLEVTSQSKLKGELKVPTITGSGEYDRNQKMSNGSYLEYLSSLKDIVFELFKQQSNQKYTLIYDELDSKFKNDSDYKNSIISLIKAANDINEYFYESKSSKIEVKVMIFLREDIFNLLNDYDLNKIKEDCSLTLDWGSNIEVNSPLVKMVINKIKMSYPVFKDLETNEIINLLFGSVTYKYVTNRNKNKTFDKTISPFNYMLTRTFLRPRDIITYLNKIIELYPNSKKFEGSYISELEKKYSDYFWDEIRNELKGHLSDEEIDCVSSLLYKFSKQTFYFDELEKYYKERKGQFGELNLKKCIALLFNFSALGNINYNNKRNKTFTKWAYREDNIEVNFEEQLTIHHGLRKRFNLF
ncbi:MAG: P-loop ATPase, Sll1717 family [Cetobacterium sp.]